jgi:hypothetical protein
MSKSLKSTMSEYILPVFNKETPILLCAYHNIFSHITEGFYFVKRLELKMYSAFSSTPMGPFFPKMMPSFQALSPRALDRILHPCLLQ